MPAGFMAIAMIGHLNLGWRHIMPVYPPLFVLAGFIGTLRISGSKWKHFIIPLLLVLNISVTEFLVFPNQMGYFSQLVGGTHNGPNILQDSNLDWGQDLPKLASFVNTSGITRLPLAYYGNGRVSTYIPEAAHLPTYDEVASTGLPSGIIGISIGSLYDKSGDYRWLWSYSPIKKIGSSIFIYSF
jgi:hypothetical protein